MTLPPFRRMSRSEEAALVKRARRGDVAARNELVVRNLRLVVLLARELGIERSEIDEAIQEGAFGLIWAAEGFDTEAGTRFSSYARQWILACLRLRGRWRTERVSKGAQQSRSPPRFVNIDAPGFDDELSTQDACTEVESRDLSARVREIVYSGSLNERERAVLERCLLADSPMRLKDLAVEFGRSRQRMQQIEAKLKRKLRSRLAELHEEVRP